MTPSFFRISTAYFRHHLFQTLLMILGVAVVIAIDLANSSAERAFQISIRTLGGKATHRLQGGKQGVPELLYRHNCN